MPAEVLISICIPAYKGIDFLQRLLNSVSIQTFRDFEVVVTDDSPDDTVKELCQKYLGRFPINYHRNPVSLGTPANWNEAIGKASGQWIKLMHDDDWFADKKSLQYFADAIRAHPSSAFIFSAYTNNYLDTGKTRDFFVDSFRFRMLQKDPVTLFSRNIIGPPSVVLHRNNHSILYDSKIKWVVDVDFYIRYLGDKKPVYINKILVNVGVGEQQVTHDCFRQRPIEIPENFYLLEKVGVNKLKNILVYDAWWRLMRNLEITQKEEIIESGYSGKIPRVISSMIALQRKLPRYILHAGILSKCLMVLHYIFNFGKIDRQ